MKIRKYLGLIEKNGKNKRKEIVKRGSIYIGMKRSFGLALGEFEGRESVGELILRWKCLDFRVLRVIRLGQF